MKTLFSILSLTFVFIGTVEASNRCVGGLINEQQMSLEVLQVPHREVHVDRAAIQVSAEAHQVLERHELPLYKTRLEQILAANGGVLSTEALKNFYQTMYFPNALIEPRLEMARLGITPENIVKILGDLSKQETLRLFVGDNPNQVMSDSLLGRYLAESGAKLQRRAFVEDANRRNVGLERFLVPVDEASFPIFKKYFSNQQTYSVYGHGHLVWQGNLLYQMDALKVEELRFPRERSPLPMVLLKTTEGQRLDRYIHAFQASGGGMGQPVRLDGDFEPRHWDTPARAPWSYIPAIGGGRYINERSAYSCCVHWQGNMPIGDRLVTEITLPGENNQPQIVQLYPPDYSNPQLALVKDVWTYPLHEPVSSMLGLSRNNGVGDFASAGWVIQTLLLAAPKDRVPFVFYAMKDRHADYDPTDEPAFERPN